MLAQYDELPDLDLIPARLHHLTRPKLSGAPATHHGIAAELWDGSTWVVDLVAGEGMGVHSLEEFRQGHRPVIRQTLHSAADVEAAWERLLALLATAKAGRYDLLSWNCEHVASYVMNGRRESSQVQVAAAAGVFVGALLLLRAS